MDQGNCCVSGHSRRDWSFFLSCLPSRVRSAGASLHLSKGPALCSDQGGGAVKKESPGTLLALCGEAPGRPAACAWGCCCCCPRRGLLGARGILPSDHTPETLGTPACGRFGCPTRGPFPQETPASVLFVKGWWAPYFWPQGSPHPPRTE